MEWSLLPAPGIVLASVVFRQKDEGMQKKSERRTKYDRIVSPGVASCLQQRLLKKKRPQNPGAFWPENYPQGLWNVETEPVEQSEQKFSFTGAVEKMRNMHTRAVEKKSLRA